MSSEGGSTDREPIRYFEPTLHFASEWMAIGEDGMGDKVMVTELVHRHGPLLSFDKVASRERQGMKKQPVMAGDNTRWTSREQNVLQATVPGYPRIERGVLAEEGRVETLVVSVEPLVRVRPDAMQAMLAVHPPLERGCSLASENLDQLLTEAGVVYGLDEEKLTEARRYVRQGLIEFCAIEVAQGQVCGPSRDAFLQFLVEIGPIAGKLLKDGTIDFRERRVMVPVNTGEVLARKIPARPGTAGINVFGQRLEAEMGRDIEVKVSGDVTFDRESNEVRATADGVLSVVRGSVISVSSRQKIKGDIDFGIGNVESRNCLAISGSVQPGFHVKADGDIEIGGTVSQATVTGAANVVIKGGITGQKTRVVADGDVDFLFIEQGRVDCGGNCVVRKQAYYSSIYAGGDIRCRRDGIVVGGELVAAGSMTLGEVGSARARPAFLAAGVEPERLEKYRQLKTTLAGLEQEIIQRMQVVGAGRSRRVRQMEREAAEIRLQLKRLNMIPGTELYSRIDKKGDEEGQAGAEAGPGSGGIDLQDITIEIQGSILAGSRIQIGNRSMLLEKTVGLRLFKLSDNQKHIMAVPLSKKRR